MTPFESRFQTGEVNIWAAAAVEAVMLGFVSL
jgi:hypothetical protein